MKNRSNFLNILIILVGLILASVALKILLSLATGILYLVFKFGIPLLIIGGVIYWLTNRHKSPRR
ncbi:hypothetical protein LQF61_04660 [Tetragenococcus koreensis]|uniref:Uncharacterized protein n=1 Tax=Tetragenococcus koreensis TaxID=290335 RepID=A0AAN4UC38_9ENTE|nr:hypothetical protein [Tetragenococcus koreensis]MDN5831624.1 hypothetical protein [Tetragenococcus halophilus]MCF1585738.1 hypothetical protein [Tetragenococcus koreensis]MCF1614848.1 hypothetical protein [Tetragenococcus koreensis]MCF1616953.1 hypothetical protein [Tetragenococcus koreensis]MCF1619373.1 hypothetical protein [Tetragenococcus koreensis]